MKQIFHAILLLAVIPSACGEPLFEADLSNAVMEGPKDCWTCTGGVIEGRNVPEGRTSNLWTKRQFKNFSLKGEFKISPGLDAGLYLRAKDEEIQIGTSIALKRDMTCSPFSGKESRYPIEAKVKGVLKEGEWNEFVVTATEGRYRITLNGKEVLDYTSKTAVAEGAIGLQAHSGKGMAVEFRKLEVSLPLEGK